MGVDPFVRRESGREEEDQADPEEHRDDPRPHRIVQGGQE